MTPTAAALGVFHDVPLKSLVDTIVTDAIGVLKTGSPDAYGHPAEVAKLFDNTTSTDPNQQGFADRARDLAGAMTASDGAITTHMKSLRDGITRNQSQQQELEDRVALTQARLTKQYGALDTVLSQINATNSSLTQSLAALANQSAALSRG